MEEKTSLILRFNKKYNKLEGVGKSATLLYTSLINLEVPDMVNFYHDFLEYDTKVDGLSSFPIYGQYIVCLFKCDESGKLFTTLRSTSDEHMRKYFGNVGKSFEVVINDK